MPFAASMKDLYERLKDVGFDAKFVRGRILPDWWEDPLADAPANRAIAEIAVSRMLGLAISALHDRTRPLALPAIGAVRLKRNKGVDAIDLMPSILLAERAARATLQELSPLRTFVRRRNAEQIRQAIILKEGCVDLKSLLKFAWDSGIAVLHLAELPQGKRFSGMALFCGKTPVVVLAHGSDSPPWLAFHLAHELGHIYLGHVAEGSGPLADSNIDQLDQDEDENAADEFACTLLTGDRTIRSTPIYGLTAAKLKNKAIEYAAAHRVDPGAVALAYGRAARRMPVAQAALQLMDLDSGAREMVAAELRQHLRANDDLPETAARFLALVSAV